MGVHGLWKLIDKAGRPIPIESLENKVLAIDVSIWLYQLVRGFDSSARPGTNMFLLGLFHRICKLLFYRIKPIFVFDGGVPSLKKKTIAARQKGRRKAQESIEKVRQQLLENLIKQQALGDVLGENVKIPKQFASKQDEMFWLPPRTEEEAVSRLEEESDSSEDERVTRKYVGDLNSVDVTSEDFLKLPADVRHDILSDLKETRKLNSWARIHLMPEEADDFSSFQMGRLLKRRAVQVGLDKAGEELGVRGFTVNDLENILTEQGIDLSQRIAGDSSTRFIYSSNTGGKKNEQSERSEDEDDVSELIHPSRDLSKTGSSDSEDEISPAVQKMASRENGDLSQTEILELIKQQHGKVSEKVDPEWNRAGTSKSCVSFPGEEESESTAEMGAHDRVNDPTVARGKHSAGNNEKSKLGPGKLPGASPFSEITTTSQKDTLLWSNQVEGVSPSKNVPGSGNEVLEEQKSLLGSNEGVESAGDESAEFASDRDDTFMEVSSDCSNQPSKIVASGLEIVVKPEDPVEDDIFADVFSRDEAEKRLKSSVEDAVAKSIMMLTENSVDSKPNTHGIDQSMDDILPKKALEIVVDPKKPIEDDDIFADVFSNPLSAKPESKPTTSESPKSQTSPKPLEIVIDTNKAPKEDIFTDIFSNPHPTKPVLSQTQTESLEPKALPKSLEIVIDPNESPDEDIFADVFSQHADTASPIPDSKADEKVADSSRNGSSSTAVSHPDDKAKSSESLEITVNPDEPPDDDLFGDVFAQKSGTNSQGAIKPSFRKLINDIKNSSSVGELSDIKNILEKESLQLAGETKREERLASTITEQITQEAQDLLELFGIPYVVAPMEAEAQCAFLDLTGQTDGTITDDSDIWLFGANNVYKNFFDQKKFVKLFKSSDIHQCYRLNREDLIMIAMLVGSDYTSGLAGVGPVNAIEIVAHFPRSQGAPTPQDRLLKFVDAYVSSEMNQQLFRKLKSIEFTDGFPSDEVVKAYLSPIVDESKEKFSWSKPDLTKIKNFMREKVGWDFNKTDKTLIPIFDKLNQSTTQKTIHNYFDWAFDVDEVATVSKRVGNAVEILTTGIVPSPTKNSRRGEPTKYRTESKDRLVSNYSRRKYGRFQQQEKELENEPVLEGMKAAKAAAKAIMAATRKPVKSSERQPSEVAGSSAGSSDVPAGASTSRGRGRPKKDAQDPKDSLANETVGSKKRKTSTTQVPVAGPSAVPVAPADAPLPALSDILCGIGSEPAAAEEPRLWTPSRDLVSPYAKRKYGKLGQSTAPRRDASNFAVPEGPRQTFDRVMPSKNPAQVARERAAKKLKEAKLKIAQSKTKKSK